MSQGNSILEIEQLSCSYTQKIEDRVLYIENLKLQKGKIIFLLGASGSGKSTLLETLGLMNNTIAEGKVLLAADEDQKFDFSQLWKEQNHDKITFIRKNFLSFIFQNTNLMESFTAYENICLSKMIKNDTDQSSAIGGAVELMKQVGLPPNEVDFDKLSVNLSGGQRQRVSFVRALNTDFKVLLCDEPTGNLDEINAHELITIVKQNLNSERTAILVSHDINLALKYADQIIVITKDESKSYSEILSENIFERENWSSLDGNSLQQFRAYLVNFFNSDGKKETANKELEITTANTSYKKLFLEKEGKVLFGKGKINLFILTTIISITLLAIGFANGALHYLDEKLNDPFVNWITVGLPWAKSDASTVQDITDKLNEAEVRNKFMIDTITAYKETPLPFFNNNSTESEFIKGRLISIDDPILKDLMGQANRISGSENLIGDNDLGIVVTKEFLRRLRYPLDARIVFLDNGDSDRTQSPAQKFKVPIPVRAVIKEIPGRNNYLITNFFYQSFVNHDKCVFDFKEQRHRLIFFAEGDKKFAKSLAGEIEKLIPSFNLTEKNIPVEEDSDSDSEYNDDEENTEQDDTNESEVTEELVQQDSLKDTLKVEVPLTRTLEVNVRSDDSCEVMSTHGYEVAVEFNAMPNEYDFTENVYKKIVNSAYYKQNNSKIFRIFDFGIAPEPDISVHNDYLCINFKKNGLDSIEAFSKYIFTNLNAENVKEETNVIVVDAGVVKEKKNFNYISKMTLLISFLLVVFSMLSISLFISNLLKTHLNKVKMNLGTFKAFGLGDTELMSIYRRIMLRFIVIGISISLLIAFVLGKIVEFWFSRWLNIEDQTEYFRMLDVQTFALLAIIITVSVLVSQINIKKILSKTPGDLIYNR